MLRSAPFVLIAALAASACQKDKLVNANCRADGDCQSGYLCENYECVPKGTAACTSVLDGNPILQPSPHTVDFGTLDSQASLVQTVTILNIGNCTLTLFEASLSDKTRGFTCDLCEGTFPKEIFPGRNLELNLGFAASTVGTQATELVFLSDDKEYPTLRVPVKATYEGTPQLVAAPTDVDFGYVAQGRQGKAVVQLSNIGTGTAPITIQSVSLSPAGTTNFALVAPTGLPRTLVPIGADPMAFESVEVDYTPRSNDTHLGELVVTTNRGLVKVSLTGTATTPAAVTVSPTTVDIGDVTLGTTNFKTLTVVNQGGAPLTVSPHWGGTLNTDFTTSPQVVPNVAAGKYVELQVLLTATQLGPYDAILLLDTNDPQQPTVSVPVHARGVPGAGPEAVKVEMTFDNGVDGVLTDDLRNVDLTLEDPPGLICSKAVPTPLNWGNYGSCTWLAFPPKEEPERIVLANATQDGTWRVMVSYQNDCKSLPTTILAAALGISLDLLQEYFAGGVIIPGKDVGGIIASICFSHKPTTADVKVFINGTQVAEQSTTLGKTGDSQYVLNLVRANGTFSVK